MSKWYVVQTKPRQESVAMENLQRQGYYCYCPMTEVERRQRGRWVCIREPLFPRYIFIQLEEGRDNFSPVRSTFGVAKLVSFGNEPATISETLVSAIREQENAMQKKNNTADIWSPGTRLQITEGPLAGVHAIFQEKNGTDRVVVLLSLLGKEIRTSIERNNLVPV